MLKICHLRKALNSDYIIPEDKTKKRALKEYKLNRNIEILTEVYDLFEISFANKQIIQMILSGIKLTKHEINIFILNDLFLTDLAFTSHIEYLFRVLMLKYGDIPIKVFINILRAINDVLCRVNHYLFKKNHIICMKFIKTLKML